jgi:predicted dehydrogenase
MKNGKLTVAIVGMGFGCCFLPIYLKHPNVEHVIMVDTSEKRLKELADLYLLDESYYTTDFEAVLQNPEVDAIHLVIPPALHAPMSIQALNAGKHTACTIPMGLSMQELEDVIKARKASGKH